MSLQLVAGQDLSPNYTLLSPLSERDQVSCWVGLDKQLNERVFIKVFAASLPEATREEIVRGVTQTRGLVHPGIARLYSVETAGDVDFIVGQLVRGGKPLAPEQTPLSSPLYGRLLDALEFAHSLGIAHGHLRPGNLLVDERGELFITDFGLPPALHNDRDETVFLSPEVTGGESPDLSDDLYSIGQLIWTSLTGAPATDGAATSTSRPIPPEIKGLLDPLLADSAYARPQHLTVAREIINRASGDDGVLEPSTGFSRVRADTNVAGSPTGERPRAVDAPVAPAQQQSGIPTGVVAIALVILLLVAAGVFFVLPEGEPATRATSEPTVATEQKPSPAAEPTTTPTEAPTKTLTPLEQARLQKLEADGEAIATELLRLQIRLEDAGVTLWAADEFAEVTRLAADADEAYRNDEFEKALGLYQSGVDQLQALIDSIPGVVAEYMDIGQEAFGAADSQGALEAYTIATAIEPENEAAQTMLERAENLDEVLGLVQDATYMENEGRLTEALDNIRAALSLDSAWQPAIDARERLAARVALQEFNDVMSEGFAALANDDLEAAEAAFMRARDLQPDSPAPTDGLAQVESAMTRAELGSLLADADSHASNENWDKAVASFEAILAIDSSVVTAANGLETAQRRAELDANLQKYIDAPTLLAEDAALADARSLLATAARINSPGPRLKAQLGELSHFITLARVPVTVEIRSDQQTDVTIYRVGQLGRIESRTLELLPGVYTIVGKRPGFRDVEHELNLIGGRQVPPVYIACTDRI